MDMSIIVLAIYTTIIITIGLYSSWEQAAIIGMAMCIAPFLFGGSVTKAYLEFLKKTLIDFQIFRITNFTYLLIFTGVVVAYAFNAWVRVIFFIIIVSLSIWKLGFV